MGQGVIGWYQRWGWSVNVLKTGCLNIWSETESMTIEDHADIRANLSVW
jgi:hypothetical protein